VNQLPGSKSRGESCRVFVTRWFITVSAIVGQAEQSDARQHLEAWAAAYSGAWTSESEAEEDSDLIKKGDKWVAKWSMVEPDKKRSSWSAHTTFPDNDTQRTTNTDRLVDGEKKPDQERTAKRK
jgi:hypothetical protein